MKKNQFDWETLERDTTRGFQILGREVENGWEIEVRFDNEQAPKQLSPKRTYMSREEAIITGRELATMG
ncbi:hypothetical protein [Salinisphaera aquimarina]|uniref:Uncharacterized protein n=1 Tax=Salinisphaera aquimarina TaxID=2094031 RepID=A0ABV7EPU3_9GAMM